MTTQAQESLKRYVSNSLHYLENALLLLQKGEAGKAGELLWGSVAEALQAVAAYQGKHLANHRSLRYFAAALAKELDDPTITDGFQRAEFLHGNFYEVDLEVRDVALAVEPIRNTVKKLLSITPEEAIQDRSTEETDG